MGRSVRRVPRDWVHPKDEKGNDIPLLNSSFTQTYAEYMEDKQQWDKGFIRNHYPKEGEADFKPKPNDIECDSYIDWAGPEPKAEDYMPDWPDEERTHYQMYEDTTEGTPISPVFATPEQLAAWLAENNVSFFADMTTSYEHWLAICKDEAVELPMIRI